MLKVSEIFYSIQGESSLQGYPSVFIRLAGCNLNCSFCDTEYAKTGGSPFSVDEIVEQVKKFSCTRVTITGGEPLMQKETVELARKLLSESFDVQVETNGSFDINVLPEGVRCILDIKTPGSRESSKNDWLNIDRLTKGDEVKFVLTSPDDYEWAKNRVKEYELTDRFTVLFSPVSSMLAPSVLAESILKDSLNVKLHLQIHKIIWPDRERGV